MIFAYEYGMPVYLGVGWSPQSPSSNKLIGGYLKESLPSDDSPSATDNFSQKFINNFNELQKTISFSLDISGRGTIGVFKASGKASYSRERKIFRNSKNIVWIISGQRKYESVSATDINITEKGDKFIQKISQSRDLKKLNKLMGSHIVTNINKISEIHLIYIFTVSNSSNIEKVKSAISGHANNIVAGGEVTSSFLDSVKTIDQSIQLEVQIKHTGIDDSSNSIAQIISAAPVDLNKVRQLMSQAIKEISWKNARIYEFLAEPFSSVFDLPDLTYDADLMNSRISRLKKIQEDIIRRYLELDDLLSREILYDITLKEGATEDIANEVEQLDLYFENLDQTIKDIYKNPSTFKNYPQITISSGRLHWISLDFGKFNEWKYEVTGNGYNSHSERIQGKAYFWPKFLLKNIDLIRRFEVSRNGTTILSISQSELFNSVESGILDAKSFFTSSHTINEYCWRGHWGEVCEPWGKDKRKIANQLKINEKSYSYLYKIIDVENNIHEYPFKNASGEIL